MIKRILATALVLAGAPVMASEVGTLSSTTTTNVLNGTRTVTTNQTTNDSIYTVSGGAQTDATGTATATGTVTLSNAGTYTGSVTGTASGGVGSYTGSIVNNTVAGTVVDIASNDFNSIQTVTLTGAFAN